MVVRDHDGRGETRTDDVAEVVLEKELEEEARLFPVVPAVTRHSGGERALALAEVDEGTAVEEDNLVPLVLAASDGRGARLGDGEGVVEVRVGQRWSDAGSKLALSSLDLERDGNGCCQHLTGAGQRRTGAFFSATLEERVREGARGRERKKGERTSRVLQPWQA